MDWSASLLKTFFSENFWESIPHRARVEIFLAGPGLEEMPIFPAALLHNLFFEHDSIFVLFSPAIPVFSEPSDFPSFQLELSTQSVSCNRIYKFLYPFGALAFIL